MEALEARKAGLESRIAALKQQATEAARRDDSRRKLLIGAAMIAAADAGKITDGSVSQMLTQFLTRPNDRAVFATGRFQIATAIPAAQNDSRE